MAGRIGRPIFRRSDVQVAVRPIRLSAVDTVEPGTVMNDLVRPHHLRGLYQRRRIGPKDHPWTIAMLEHDGFYKPEAHSGKALAPEAEEVIEQEVEEVIEQEVEETEAETEQEAEEVAEDEKPAGLMGRLMGKGKGKDKPAKEEDGDDWLDAD